MANKSQIGKKNQANGHRFEIKVWNKCKHKDTIDRAISSGSKGKTDVWSLTKDKLFLNICKTNGYLDPKERRDINTLLERVAGWVVVRLWYYKSKRKASYFILKKGWEYKYNKLISQRG